MEQRKKQFFLTDTEGKKVPVSENIYDAYWQYTNKEDYFMRQLKEERFRYDPERQIAEFLPSREDSYERLLEEGAEFMMNQPSVEEQAEIRILQEILLRNLKQDEVELIRLFYFSGKTDREISRQLGIPKSTLADRKKSLLERCGRILNYGYPVEDTS